MIDIKAFREDAEPFRESVRLRGLEFDFDKLTRLDTWRLQLIRQIEDKRAQLNLEGKPSEVELEKLKQVKTEVEQLEGEFEGVDREFTELVEGVPNLVAKEVPIGPNESGNQVLRRVGKQPRFNFTPKEHWQLGADLDVIDNERAAKVAGARFTYLKGGLAKLQFSLIQYALGALTDRQIIGAIAESKNLKVAPTPFVPVVPPAVAKTSVYQATGRLKKEEQTYKLDGDDLWLNASAEHTLAPMYMGEILDEKELPIRYVGYTTAFRREAGTYGRDTRGILRMHQFDKLEMESFTVAEDSGREQEFLVAVQEYLMSELELPYQVVAICTGDMSSADLRQIDIETWMPGQNVYRETHSCDLLGDFQARGMRTRVKRADGRTELVHTGDATAFAIGRTLIAIMENYQTKEGNIRIPTVLQDLYGGELL